MIQPNDINKVEDKDWEEFKKKAAQDDEYHQKRMSELIR